MAHPGVDAQFGCSVIVPSFNHGPWLGDAIESVAAQTVPVLEVIVVDDGSTDSTASVAAQFPGVRYVHQDNAGVAAARNRGLELAKGSHVVFLDADDMLAPTYLEECLRVLQNSGAGYAYPTAQLVGVEDLRWPAAPFDVDALKRQNFVPVTVLLDLRKVGDAGFDTNRKLSAWEDWELFVRLANRGVYGVPAPKAVFCYRKHDHQCSRIDRHLRDPLAEPRAVRYMQKKHRGFFTAQERLETLRVIARRHVWVLKRWIKRKLP
jgi:glycosyltransferase involved in cell wall biosynthesis